MEAEGAAWQEEREMNQARVEALNIVEEFHRNRPRTETQMRLLWERLQSAQRRARRIGEPFRSYDDMMVWAKTRKLQQLSESEVVELGAGVAGVGVGQEQQQQQQPETEASPETPRTPAPHASSVQQQQQSEPEVMKVASAGVGGADHQHVFLGARFLGLESRRISKELRLRRAGAAARVQRRSRR